MRRAASALAAVALAASVTLGGVAVASANPIEGIVSGIANAIGLGDTRAVSTVQGLTPEGITIDMFDYWVNAENEGDAGSSDSNFSRGINSNGYLKFTSNGYGTSSSGSDSSINGWTGRNDRNNQGGPRTGIVQNRLVNGYPVLANGQEYDADSYDRNNQTYYYNQQYIPNNANQSLAYLFNSNDVTTAGNGRVSGKRSYMNVGGLLKLDEDGNYVYDSQDNFASLVDGGDSNDFVLYSKPGVNASTSFADSQNGQFFPFNTGMTGADGSVFPTDNSTINSGSGDLNKFFGMHMSANFVQPTNGQTANSDMQFDFSGDDDVWVFIDGVLVGDIGGCHDRLTLHINFATGEINVRSGARYNNQNNNTNYQPQNDTLLKAFEAAGAKAETTWDDDTFAGGTYHKIDFFYMERGGGNSNMKLTTNLVSPPASNVLKVDQDNKPVDGAQLALYEADVNDGAWSKKGAAIASGTTQNGGVLTLADANSGKPINFSELATKGITHFILEETGAPAGYRTTGEFHLNYVTGKAAGSIGFLISDNPLETGTYASPVEKITIPGNENPEVEDINGRTHTVADNSQVYAVILRRQDVSIGFEDANNATNWRAVSGDAQTGYTQSDAAITDPSQTDGEGIERHYFEKSTDSRWSVTLQDLPGDPREYYYFSNGKSFEGRDILYSVAYYYKENEKATPVRLNDSDFMRETGATLRVSNLNNRLLVQKVDDAGSPVTGATFGLYTADQINFENGKPVSVKNGQTAVKSDVTKELTREKDGVALDGGILFKDLDAGVPYYLVEISAPNGYVKSDVITPVYVDANGTHADAGEANDGVKTIVGVGALLKSMAQFGSSPSVDATLHDITAIKQTGELGDNWNFKWSNVEGESIDLTYGADSALLEYGATNAGDKDNTELGFTTHEGWIDVSVKQNAAQYGENSASHKVADAYKHKLGDTDISKLFTGSTTVQVMNKRISSLDVSKKVVIPSGLTGDPDASFPFKITVENAETNSYDASIERTIKKDDGTTLTYFLKFYKNDQGEIVAWTKYNGNGEPEDVQQDVTLLDTFPMTFENGVRWQNLKDGETLHIYGLPSGSKYTVEEAKDSEHAIPNGYEQTAPVDDESGKPTSVTGTLNAADYPHKAEFENTYSVEPVEHPTVADFGVQKTLTGRTGDQWTANDSYLMVLKASSLNGDDSDVAKKSMPLPTGNNESTQQYEWATSIKSNTPDHEVTFTGLEYKQPGVYVYNIFERTPDVADRLPGVSYSSAMYVVTVNVIDNGDGTMSVKSVSMKQIADDEAHQDFEEKVTGSITLINDQGNVVESPQVSGSLIAAIKNTFSVKTIAQPLNATKNYVNNSGGNQNVDDKFTFTVAPISDTGNTGATILASMPSPGNTGWDNASSITQTQGAKTDGSIAFGNFTFTNDRDAGHTYVYELREVFDESKVTEGNGYKYNNLQYDPSVYRVQYKLTLKDANDQNSDLECEVTWTKWNADTQKWDVVTLTSGRPVFTNTYDPEDATYVPTVAKTLTGRNWQTRESFVFTIEPSASMTDVQKGYIKLLPQNATAMLMQGKVDKSGKIIGAQGVQYVTDFGTITFTHTGRYSFDIKEKAGTQQGYGFDGHTATLTLTVEDEQANGESTGRLVVTQASIKYANTGASNDADSNDQTKAAFTNEYSADATYELGITVTKKLTGRAMKAHEFSFTIEGKDEAAQKKIDGEGFADDKRFTTPNDNEVASGTLVKMANKLQGIEFTEADIDQTYTFTVKENVESITDKDANAAGLQSDGVTYDLSQYEVAITVRDNGDGTLKTETTVTKVVDEAGNTIDETDRKPETFDSSDSAKVPTVAFENEYEASSTTVTDTTAIAPLVKKLDGLDWNADTDPAEDKTVTPSFEFTIKKQSYTSLVEGSEEETNGDNFAGMPLPSNTAGKTDKVTVDASSKTHVPSQGAEADAARKDFGFGPMTFTKTGIYKYTVTETIPGEATHPDVKDGEELLKYSDSRVTEKQRKLVGWTYKGITYSNETATITITVRDNGEGSLYPDVKASDRTTGEAHFTNTYAVSGTAETKLSVTKAIQNHAAPEGGFTFTLALVEGQDATNVEMPNGLNKTTGNVLTVDNPETLEFDAIKFKAKGTYKFTITETDGNVGGWTYDTHAHEVTVVVADDNQGGLVIDSVTYDGSDHDAVSNGNSLTVTNTYSIPDTASASVSFSGEKTMTGRDFKQGDAFTFTVKGKVIAADGTVSDLTGNKLPASGSVTINPANGKKADINFGKLTFNAKDDLNKTFEYTFTETDPGNGQAVKGVSYNTGNAKSYTVKFKVVDNDKGGIKIELVSGDGIANGEMAQNGNDASYTGIDFTNEYEATTPALASLHVTKKIEGDAGADAKAAYKQMYNNGQGNAFNFTLKADMSNEFTKKNLGSIKYEKDGGLTSFEESTAIPVSTDADLENSDTQQLTFANLKFTKAGDYVFVVDETNNDGNGWTVDKSTPKITVHVKDNLDGSFVLDTAEESTGIKDDNPTFTNKYATASTATATLNLAGTKTLASDIGRKFLAGDSFTFNIVATGNNVDAVPMPSGVGKNGDFTLSFTKDSDKSTEGLEFGTITFGAADRGQTYTYVITETNSGGSSNGITNNTGKDSYTVTVKVEDDGQGGIKLNVTTAANSGTNGDASITDNNDSAVKVSDVDFTNTYEATGDSNAVVLNVMKQIEGKDGVDADAAYKSLLSSDAAFEFTLKPNEEHAFTKENLASIKTADDKQFTEASVKTTDALTTTKPQTLSFDGIKFSKAGTYQFVVDETNVDGKGWKVDSSTKIITVEVVNNQHGGYQANKGTDDNPVFTNTYSLDGASGTAPLGVKKTIENHIANQDFSFTLKPKGEPYGDQVKIGGDAITANGVSATVKKEALTTEKSGTASFGNLVFTAESPEGGYQFTVSENDPNTNGWTVDHESVDVTFTVTDNHDGSLKVAVAQDDVKDGFVDFTNTYAANGKLAIKGTKVLKDTEGVAVALDGRTFDFELKAGAGDKATEEAVGKYVLLPEKTKVSSDKDGNYAFDDITFKFSGKEEVVYTFTVSELGSKYGYIINDEAKTVKVKVTDQGNGKLKAEIISEGENKSDSLTFTNVYAPTANDELIGAKYIEGRNFTKDDSFTFKVTADNGASLPDGVDGSGNITIKPIEGADSATIDFGKIKFTKKGTYTYTVTELGADGVVAGGTKNGLTYDASSYKVTVEVEDNGFGVLTVHEPVITLGDNAVDKIAFTNVYKPNDTTVDTNVETDTYKLFSKTLEGRDWNGEDKFDFAINAVTADAPKPSVQVASATKPENGATVRFGFGTIKFTDADMKDAVKKADGSKVKDFVYEVTEKPYSIPGVTPKDDDQIATLTITVTDNGKGAMTATPKVMNGEFVNVYSTSLDYTATSGLQIAKTLTGRDMVDGQFEFTVTPKDDASAKKLGIAKEGQVVKSVAASNGQKVIMPVALPGKVEFTNADAKANSVYTYTVKETKIGDASKGYANDTSVQTVTIKPTFEASTGDLTVTTTVTKNGAVVDEQKVSTADKAGAEKKIATVAFDNSYAAKPATLGGEGSVKIEAVKQLANREQVAGEFTFNVINNAKAAAGAEPVATGTNAADGTISFSDIEYTTERLEADYSAHLAGRTKADGENGAYTYTYDYKVAEDTSKLPEGVSAVAPSFNVKVTVTDKLDGSPLDIKVTYPDDQNSLTFQNTYGTTETAKVNVSGTKMLNVLSGDNVPDIAGKYTFTLTGSEGAPMPKVTTSTNDKAGNVPFGDIEYTMENVFGTTGDELTAVAEGEGADEAAAAAGPRTKTFTYTVKESGSVPGVTNDPAAQAGKTFTVTVADNSDGTISAKADPAGAKFAFVNTYQVTPTESTPTGEGALTVTKVLAGRNMAKGEFAFELLDEAGQVKASGTNEAAKAGEAVKVQLSAVKFDKPGSYNFKLREAEPAEGKLGGVEYDPATYAVTAKVVDNGDGTLSVTWSSSDKTLAFHNEYKVAETTLTVGASKVLEGADLKDGQFTFQLTNSFDEVHRTAKNDANGTVVFDPLRFDRPGVYEYTISEVNDGQDNVEYDKNTYHAKVTVTDNGAGQLVAEVAYENGAVPVFKNTYVEPKEPSKPTEPTEPEPSEPKGEEPKEPESELPQTGDNAPSMGLLAAIGAAGVAMIAGGAVLVKRRK